MLGFNEGHKDGKAHETGKWVAYNAAGQKVGEGLIGPEESALGKNKKRSGSYGAYPIKVNANTKVQRVEVMATGFGHGKYPPRQQSYGENNSDLAIIEVSYTR